MDPVKVRLMFDALIPPHRLDRVLRAASRLKVRARVQQRKRRKPKKSATSPKKTARVRRPPEKQ